MTDVSYFYMIFISYFASKIKFLLFLGLFEIPNENCKSVETKSETQESEAVVLLGMLEKILKKTTSIF